jgi:hypothetical protein
MEMAFPHHAIEEMESFDRSVASLTSAKSVLAKAQSLQGWLDAKILQVATFLAEASSYPEHDIARAAHISQKSAAAVMKRAETIALMPEFGLLLASGTISTEHVDALTYGLRRLKAAERPRLIARSARLALLATRSTPEEFGETVRAETENIASDDGADVLAQQKRAARLRTWWDKTSRMWCVRGQFDPESGIIMNGRVEGMLASKFAEKVPDGAPDDPTEKQDWLRAQAFVELVCGERAIGSGIPETVVVVDTTDGTVRWPFDVYLPSEVLQRFINRSKVHFVDIHLGTIRDAPGNLNLGRTRRLANRAQRRALGALYATCAIPGCSIKYDKTRLHHVWFWEDGGPTDLHNLLPLCSRHHHQVHDGGWKLHLSPQRALTVTLPDGRVMATGPPGTLAA